MKWKKSKTEASGYGGQAEPYMHTIRVDGDYDMDRGIPRKRLQRHGI